MDVTVTPLTLAIDDWDFGPSGSLGRQKNEDVQFRDNQNEKRAIHG
jgi:hypothetical protein